MTDMHRRMEAEIPSLRRYARALVRDVVSADDLVQECLTRALTKLDLWREGSDLRAWLFTILHNQHVNHVRRSIRAGMMLELDESASRRSSPPNQEAALELRDFDRALGELPADQRAVILLIGLEGMPYAEVAAKLEIPVGTVRSRLSRGRLALRDLMGFESSRGDERQPSKTRAVPLGATRPPVRAEGSGLQPVAG